MKGRYVLFEGMDGSGKSTLAAQLESWIRQALHQPVRRLAFPSRESRVGALIRDVFENGVCVDKNAMFWLFLAEAKDMEPLVRRTIESGAWLICDRHVQVSSLVYQSEIYGQDCVRQVVEAARLTMPDRIYFVDVPAKVALERRQMRSEPRNVLYESEDLDRLEQMRQAYRALATSDRFAAHSAILDGTVPIEQNLRWIRQDLGWPLDPFSAS
jgi:dTMP kinase